MNTHVVGSAIGVTLCGAGAFVADQLNWLIARTQAIPGTIAQISPPIPDAGNFTGPSAGVWFAAGSALAAIITAIGTAWLQPWLNKKAVDEELKTIKVRLDAAESAIKVKDGDLASKDRVIGQLSTNLNGAMDKAVRLAADILSQTGHIKQVPPNFSIPISDSLPDPDGPRVLIVEDSEPARSAVADMLTFQHFRVRGVGTIQDAINAINVEVPDVVILDLMLPDGDGVDLLARIKSDNLPSRVIVTTGKAPAELVAVRKLNPTAILTKPFELFDDLMPYLKTARAG